MAKTTHALIRKQVKFIKFFAWEERWIGRALDAREVEMKWMVKGILVQLRWYIPILTTFVYSSRQLGAFLSPLDLRADLRLYHLVHDLCYARKSVDD